MSARLSSSVADRRFRMLVLGTFAALALILAAVGLYGVVSSSVAQETREIGIRMALGAQAGERADDDAATLADRDPDRHGRRDRRRSGLHRADATLLYEVSPGDPLSLAALVLAMSGVAPTATYVPAWRGTRVDPPITMRAE